MDQSPNSPQAGRDAAVLSIPRWEFIALCAALMALNSLAIDIMLPALQQIGGSLGVQNPNHRQYVITAYIVSFGIAQLAYGPLSDRFGRRLPLLAGLAIYVIAAFAAVVAPTFEMLLLCRFIQGIGAASTRVIAISVVRDTFGGRRMAEILSLIFMVFMAVPVVAPGLGQLVMMVSSWHMIFAAMGTGASAIGLWALLRLPETLKPENRRPFTLSSVTQGFGIVLSNRVALCYTLAGMFTFASLFGFINSAQQVFVGIYDLGTWFPLVFAIVASLMAVSNFSNARLVGAIGMRRLSQAALICFILISAVWFALALAGPIPFPVFITLFTLDMLVFGLIGSNFNALAMEPLGHVAGTASSVLGFTQTFGGGVLGTLIGQSFDGTVRPLAAGFCAVSVIAFLLVMVAERGKLFQPHNPPVR